MDRFVCRVGFLDRRVDKRFHGHYRDLGAVQKHQQFQQFRVRIASPFRCHKFADYFVYAFAHRSFDRPQKSRLIRNAINRRLGRFFVACVFLWFQIKNPLILQIPF